MREVLLLIAALTASPAIAQAQAGPAQAMSQAPAEDIVPVADHHIHLLSPMAAALLTPPPLPPIKLPDDLASVVRARNELRGDQAALSQLYTSDALYYRGGTSGWSVGREAAAGHVRWSISDWPYRIVPVAFNRHGASAQIAGYFLEGKDLDERFGNSLLSLVKGDDGRWRIAAETYIFDQPRSQQPVTAADKIAEMDAAGTRVAAVLSNAYYFDAVRPEAVPDPYTKVRADNDWTASQASQFPHRLAAFCSFNPTKSYALEELDRCASSGRFRGLKLNFNAAQLNLRDPVEVAKVRAVLARANEHRMPMIIHVRPGNVYGREEAEIVLRQLLPAAPDVPIQIAHLWGGENYAASALQVFADAMSSKDPATRNLYFDISGLASFPTTSKSWPEIVARIRQIGLNRILYGSDAPVEEAWSAYLKNIPLTQAELQTIAMNVAPYLKPLDGK